MEGFLIGVVIAVLILGGQWLFFERKKKTEKTVQTLQPIVNVDLGPIYKLIEGVPNKVLQSIVSSSNNMKGNLGELMGFLKLKAEYDRVIPLGNIVDFIGIKLPKDGKEGQIDFIDIKTDKAKLSKDQSQLKKLIAEKRINFVKISIKMSTEAEYVESSSENNES